MTTMRLTLGAVLLSLLGSFVAAQAPPNARHDRDALLIEARQSIETADFRATGRLLHIAADGSRTSYKISIKGHWFPDGLRLLYEVKAPAEARVRLLLHMAANGSTTIEVVHPGSSPSELGLEHRHDSLLGTDFSYEDLVDSQLFFRSQSVLPPAKCGARDCFVLKSVPAAEDHSQYGSVISWIDKNIFYPIHVVKTIRATGEQKDFTYEGLRQSSGVWSASQIEVKVPGKPGSSLLIIERGSAKAQLGRKDFELGQPFPQVDE